MIVICDKCGFAVKIFGHYKYHLPGLTCLKCNEKMRYLLAQECIEYEKEKTN